MAEIIRTRQVVTKQNFSRRDPGEPVGTTVETVTVRSILSDRLDVSVLRDLVAALDAANIHRGTVTAFKSDVGHLTQLVVEAELGPGADEGSSQ